MRNDNITDENPHIIVGTLIQMGNEVGCNEIPRGVTHVIKNKAIKLFAKIFLDCDIIIYDISTNNLDEIRFALKSYFKSSRYSRSYIFHCISNNFR